MTADRLARLTEKQRVCLRMVYMHMSSKEIARELGIGADAVDQRLKTAMRTLGVESRVDAARLLAEHEGAMTYQRPVYQPSDVVPDAVLPTLGPRANEGAGAAPEPAGTMHVCYKAARALNSDPGRASAWRAGAAGQRGNSWCGQ